MKIIFFAHPAFIPSQSMPRYATWLAEGMAGKGYTVEIWRPKPQYYNWKVPASLKKWMGYIDQYLVFPKEVKRMIKDQPSNTLFVFTDQALGPWIPLANDRPHVVHCHDFLAQHSAMGKIAENPTGWTGRKYQKYIRNGYRQARNFVSVSEQTRKDLHELLDFTPMFSEVVYNGLTREFTPAAELSLLRNELSAAINLDLSRGYILHVGGNQWYKNREGVIRIYDAWRQLSSSVLPLLMVGAPAPDKLQRAKENAAFGSDIHFLPGMSDMMVRKMYAGASLFLFPSLAEGFGWPIVEAMASGCLVITTGEAPMTEVAADAAFYIKRRPAGDDASWAHESALIVEQALSISDTESAGRIARGIRNATRFDPAIAMNKIEHLYKKIVEAKLS